jgi:hypothetical protein
MALRPKRETFQDSISHLTNAAQSCMLSWWSEELLRLLRKKEINMRRVLFAVLFAASGVVGLGGFVHASGDPLQVDKVNLVFHYANPNHQADPATYEAFIIADPNDVNMADVQLCNAFTYNGCRHPSNPEVIAKGVGNSFDVFWIRRSLYDGTQTIVGSSGPFIGNAYNGTTVTCNYNVSVGTCT